MRISSLKYLLLHDTARAADLVLNNCLYSLNECDLKKMANNKKVKHNRLTIFKHRYSANN